MKKAIVKQLILEIKKKNWYGEDHMTPICSCEVIQHKQAWYEKCPTWTRILDSDCPVHAKSQQEALTSY